MSNSDHGGRPAAQADHPSSAWTLTLDRSGPGPLDPARFAAAMRDPAYPRASAYDPAWVYRNLMGPNCLWLLEDLLARLPLAPDMRVLDLGCGSALSSIFLARELGVEVWAADLWIDPTDNLARAREAGVADRLFPLRAEAHALPFAHGFFDAIVSVDAYHYFGTDIRYLSYLAQFVKAGGRVGIAVPGNAIDPDEAPPTSRALFEELGADWFAFRSADWWRRHFERTRGIAVEDAAMVDDGAALWNSHVEAVAAWRGTPKAEQFEGRLLSRPEGRELGFCRIVARREEGRTLLFGPGDFETRIA
ncbi:MAG: methyltransferase domain-containing protein [Pseudomonadota bacterium]|nr:methyltransferase domain-containing protein [Pseudomonadota bacterium]